MRLDAIKVDVKAQEEGEWIDHPAFHGVRVKLRSPHSDLYQRKLRSIQNAAPRGRKKRGMGDEIDEFDSQIRKARCVLIADFSGIEDENGEPVAYTPEIVEAWSKDPAYRLFFDGLIEAAQEIGERETEDLEESGKGSRKRSAGTSKSPRPQPAIASS